MANLKKNSIVALNLSKTILYSIEYKILYQLSKRLSFFVKPPRVESDKNILKTLEREVLKIHNQDAQNILDGYYPAEVLIPKAPLEHLKNLPTLLLDSLKISRRRKLNIKKDFAPIDLDLPSYLNRNYHFQSDGYFSDESAKLYEHQVEVLFSGTAAPMRRMLIKLIKENLSNDRPLRILEIGAGVGTATLDFSKSFSIEQYVVSDVSAPYLKLAQKRLGNTHFKYVCASGEQLPFPDGEFDLVFSVYLFHELPRSAREKVLTEAKRVLKNKGVLGICDSLQKDDNPLLNEVLENFPLDYHEPFYKDYTLWDVKENLEKLGFTDVNSTFHLLSKYWVAINKS